MRAALRAVVVLVSSLMLFPVGARAQANPDWHRAIPGFKIAGNLYYVGTADLAAYLIATPQGNILINGNFKEDVPAIRKSIEGLGFKYADTKILLISHAHGDHDEGIGVIKSETGARLMVMDADVAAVESTAPGRPGAKVDRILHDRDTVELGGSTLTVADRNFWGVTFGADDNVFYATAASGGHTWLVRGDLTQRELTGIRDGVECPSLSPDGTRIAFKKNVSSGPVSHWAIAVLDLATGAETVLDEKRSVDDQVEWLDNGTLLYGLPRTDAPGDSDVWSVAIGSEPTVFIPHAWSPSVVR